MECKLTLNVHKLSVNTCRVQSRPGITNRTFHQHFKAMLEKMMDDFNECVFYTIFQHDLIRMLDRFAPGFTVNANSQTSYYVCYSLEQPFPACTSRLLLLIIMHHSKSIQINTGLGFLLFTRSNETCVDVFKPIAIFNVEFFFVLINWNEHTTWNVKLETAQCLT